MIRCCLCQFERLRSAAMAAALACDPAFHNAAAELPGWVLPAVQATQPCVCGFLADSLSVQGRCGCQTLLPC
eukprot:364588-Chlamydomonas_euryale.AAC.7